MSDTEEELRRLKNAMKTLLKQCEICDKYEILDEYDSHCFVCGINTCEDCYELCSCEPTGAHCCLKCVDNHDCIKHGKRCY